MRQSRSFIKISVLFFIILPIVINAQVSEFKEYRETPTIPYGGAQHYLYLGADRELQITVQIWGKICKPGLYSIPKTTDIIGLISFAGGPDDGANLSKVKIVRNNPQPQVLTVNVKKYLNSGKLSDLPLLKPGDTIIISESPSNKIFPGFLQVLSVASQAAAIISMYYIIVNK